MRPAYSSLSEDSASRTSRTNKTDFRCDLMAALTEKGVRDKQRRWHDPVAGLKHGNGKVSRGLSRVRMKRDVLAAAR